MQRIIVFEEQGSGKRKIEGIGRFGQGIEIIKVIDVGGPFPEFVDEPEVIIDTDFSADLCLNYIRHPDLSLYLIEVCNKKAIPVVASGQKVKGALTPFTCCGLGHHPSLGPYGRQFGVPELEVLVEGGKIKVVSVLRGAPCGLTWDVAEAIEGLPVDEALSTFGRLIQYECVADPAKFDPISQKSQLHFAGDVHIRALKKAISLCEKRDSNRWPS